MQCGVQHLVFKFFCIVLSLQPIVFISHVLMLLCSMTEVSGIQVGHRRDHLICNYFLLQGCWR